jgi:threonine/homoserine/homoserine lactone efflux protein
MCLFLIGALAGLGVAMPLGAIGVLLIREGVVAGFRVAAAAALAVGVVDAAYCGVAVTVGAFAATWLAALGAAPALVSGLILIALGISGLVQTASTVRPTDTPVPGSAVGVFLRFAGLTAVNPATLVYFLALAATLTPTGQLGGSLNGGVPAFVAGVAIASMAWQLGLAGVGAILGGRLRPSGQRVLKTVGSGIVLALGVAALVAASVYPAGS